MRFYIKTLLIAIVFSFIEGQVKSQLLPEAIERKIDSLFERWNNTNSPGCAVGIVRNDSLIFSKGYGLSNLEYNLPITPETIFYMASLSKQFTGYCIVLLARQGKINLDEDIHVYLPWVSDFGKKITVRNLLNHTSGIRDDIGLAAISGLGDDGMFTQDLAINILKRQHSLNFDPGEQYSYSNSNFVLLAEIIKAVSGKGLQVFADSAIFKPLSMSNSRFLEDYTQLIKNKAASYDRLDSSRYANDVQRVYTVGPGGLFTNITDMAKWVSNFYNPKAGDSIDINQLTQKGRLNNKREISYALGIAVDNYRGKKMFVHDGSASGYRTFICICLDLKMGFLVFSNVRDFDPSAKGFEMADFFINTDKSEDVETVQKMDSSKTLLKDTITIKKFIGNYISDDGIQADFRLSNGKLYEDVFGQSFLLLQQKTDTFCFYNDPQEKFLFKINAFGEPFVFFIDHDETHLFKTYVVDTTQSDKELKAYSGTYECPELDCSYHIALKDHHLFLTSNKYNDTGLSLVGTDHLFNDYWWMNHLVVIRNNKKQITGFEVNSGRIMHLKFNKIK